ncbi:MAG: ABC transporter ATP-binding protein [Phycisphaerales bacterium]
MTDSAISIRNVSKAFGPKVAVSDLSLEVPRGSVCGFLGPNGAGKSTTIRMIMSIIYPDSGNITVVGGSALDNKDRIGYLPEERGVYRKMRVGEFLRYVSLLKGTPREGLDRRIAQWLERIELKGVIRSRCQELSKGMQQKVQFLASIMHDPELIILDEPFSGLDPVNAVILNRLIDELHEAGKTIIFSTHVLHQAEQICDRIFLINHGHSLLDDSLDNIRSRFDPRTIVAEPVAGALDVADVAGVASVAQMEGSSGAAVEITLRDGVDPHQVMHDILQQQPLRRIELRRPTLEDIFVELVRADEGAAAAQEARETLAHV